MAFRLETKVVDEMESNLNKQIGDLANMGDIMVKLVNLEAAQSNLPFMQDVNKDMNALYASIAEEGAGSVSLKSLAKKTINTTREEVEKWEKISR